MNAPMPCQLCTLYYAYSKLYNCRLFIPDSPLLISQTQGSVWSSRVPWSCIGRQDPGLRCSHFCHVALTLLSPQALQELPSVELVGILEVFAPFKAPSHPSSMRPAQHSGQALGSYFTYMHSICSDGWTLTERLLRQHSSHVHAWVCWGLGYYTPH